MSEALELVRLGFRTDAVRPTHGYLGAKLRGALGRRLKQLACPLDNKSPCKDCLMSGSCVFGYLYISPPDPEVPTDYQYAEYPHPYVLDMPEEDDADTAVRFSLTLVGRGIEYFPFFVQALWGLRLIPGARPGRVVSVLDLVDTESGVVFDGSVRRFMRKPSKLTWTDLVKPEDEETKELTLDFVTPTKIFSNGRPADFYSFPLLVAALQRRVVTMAQRHCGSRQKTDFKAMLDRAATIETAAHHMPRDDRFRGYSGRQQQEHHFTGLVGSVAYRGQLGEFLPLLRAGELLHVGSKATFGCGQYVIRSVS